MYGRNRFIMSAKKMYQKVLILSKGFKLKHYRNNSLKQNRGLLAVLIIFNTLSILQAGANGPLNTYVSPAVKTVQFHRDGWPFSYPLLRLNSQQQLRLTFDEPGSGMKNYHYTLVHCDANWNPSPLMPTDYLKGNPLNPIEDYQYSFNTTFDYIHYQLKIPNEHLSVTRSGNYALLVFEDFKQDEPVLVQQFMVHEGAVQIIPNIKNTAQSSVRASHQEINFEVAYGGLQISNPNQEVSATIIQNGRSDNAITGLPPQFFTGDRMDFHYGRTMVMEGGNEFRYADVRSTRFYSDRVADIQLADPFFHIRLTTDYPRNPGSYQYRQDLNGRYYIEVQEHDQPELEADYVFVHFSLKTPQPLLSQQVYLNGALTNWQLDQNALMDYDADTDTYRKTLLLKQGYYNYQYLVQDYQGGNSNLLTLENSHYETENDYLILLYYKGAHDRTHRLIGAEITNSLRRESAY